MQHMTILGALMAAASAPTTTIDVPDDFVGSPIDVEVSTPAPTVKPKTLGGGKCAMFHYASLTSAAPSVGFTLASTRKLTMTIEGASGAVLELPSGRLLCARRPEVDMAEWPSGAYRLYIVQQDATPRKFKLGLVDRTVVDSSPTFIAKHFVDTIEAVAVGPLDEPFVARTKVNRGVKPHVRVPSRCDKTLFPGKPNLLLDVGRPFSKMSLRLVFAEADAKMFVVGPVNEPARAGSWCDAEGTVDLKNAQGTYAVYVGVAREGTLEDIAVVVTTPKTPVAPLFAPMPIPATLTLEQRQLDRHFVGLSPRRLRGSGSAWRSEIFITAPKQLFVYARFDAEGTHPKKNEALLVLRADRERVHVLAADGETASIRRREHLALEPDGEVFVPATPRSDKTPELDEAIRLAAPTEAKRIATYEAQKKRFEECYYGYWEKQHPGGDLMVVTYRGGKIQKVEDLADRVHAAGMKKCHGAAFDRASTSVLKHLQKKHREQQTAHLAAVQKRLTQP